MGNQESPMLTLNIDQIWSIVRGSGYAAFGALAAYLLQYAGTVDQSQMTGLITAAVCSILGNAILKWIPAWK